MRIITGGLAAFWVICCHNTRVLSIYYADMEGQKSIDMESARQGRTGDRIVRSSSGGDNSKFK